MTCILKFLVVIVILLAILTFLKYCSKKRISFIVPVTYGGTILSGSKQPISSCGIQPSTGTGSGSGSGSGGFPAPKKNIKTSYETEASTYKDMTIDLSNALFKLSLVDDTNQVYNEYRNEINDLKRQGDEVLRRYAENDIDLTTMMKELLVIEKKMLSALSRINVTYREAIENVVVVNSM